MKTDNACASIHEKIEIQELDEAMIDLMSRLGNIPMPGEKSSDILKALFQEMDDLQRKIYQRMDEISKV